jgi:hypothetical protein
LEDLILFKGKQGYLGIIHKIKLRGKSIILSKKKKMPYSEELTEES